MRVLVTGATGFIGSTIASRLVADGHDVRAATRRPGKYQGRGKATEMDVSVPGTLDAALEGCDVAYYLVHALGERGDFAQRETAAAESFAVAASRHEVRVVYLGGLGDENPDAARSRHLQSRHEVGHMLRDRADTVELQAAVVVGNGSAAYELLRHMVTWLPVMVMPKWVRARVQPIGIDDLVRYLIAAPSLPAGRYQVGGGDVLTYEHMVTCYAQVTRRRRSVVTYPVLVPALGAVGMRTASQLLAHLPTAPSTFHLPVPSITLALRLAEGLPVDVIVTDDRIRQLVPFSPIPYREAVIAAEKCRRRTLRPGHR